MRRAPSACRSCLSDHWLRDAGGAKAPGDGCTLPGLEKLQRLHKRQQIFVELVLMGQREAVRRVV
ncbi:TPA: hypothetical protein ACG0DT_004806, partial [Enterobacter asburiae]